MDTVDHAAPSEEILIELDQVKLLQDEKDEGTGKLVLTSMYVVYHAKTIIIMF